MSVMSVDLKQLDCTQSVGRYQHLVMSDQALRLENQVCFPLYAAARAITQAYQPLLAKLGLTYPQYLVLLLLWEHDGLAVKALGQRLYLDSGTLTPLLKRMEE